MPKLLVEALLLGQLKHNFDLIAIFVGGEVSNEREIDRRIQILEFIPDVNDLKQLDLRVSHSLLSECSEHKGVFVEEIIFKSKQKGKRMNLLDGLGAVSVKNISISLS